MIGGNHRLATGVGLRIALDPGRFGDVLGGPTELMKRDGALLFRVVARGVGADGDVDSSAVTELVGLRRWRIVEAAR